MRLQDLDFRVWDNKRKKYIEDYMGIFKLFVFDKNISDMKRTLQDSVTRDKSICV